MFEFLQPRVRGGAVVERLPGGITRLEMPAGDQRSYRLAQLDDTGHLRRRSLLWRPPCTLELQARVSAPGLPGTWGFGLWNEPFSMGGTLAGAVRVFPALPQAAWFFHASVENHLSIHSDVPGNGFFAGVMQASRLPAWPFLPAAPVLPLLFWKPAARLVRRVAGKLVRQAGATLPQDVTAWHTYRVEWMPTGTALSVDGEIILTTGLTPRPPLSLVIWIDNQFAAFTPAGKVAAGTLANPGCWLEVKLD